MRRLWLPATLLITSAAEILAQAPSFAETVEVARETKRTKNCFKDAAATYGWKGDGSGKADKGEIVCYVSGKRDTASITFKDPRGSTTATISAAYSVIKIERTENGYTGFAPSTANTRKILRGDLNAAYGMVAETEKNKNKDRLREGQAAIKLAANKKKEAEKIAQASNQKPRLDTRPKNPSSVNTLLPH